MRREVLNVPQDLRHYFQAVQTAMLTIADHAGHLVPVLLKLALAGTKEGESSVHCLCPLYVMWLNAEHSTYVINLEPSVLFWGFLSSPLSHEGCHFPPVG